MSGQDTSTDDISAAAEEHAENWTIYKTSSRYSQALAVRALDAIHEHIGDRRPGFDKYRRLKDKRSIDAAVFNLAKRYYRQKADYLLVANRFERTGVVKLAEAYRSLIGAFEELTAESVTYINLERVHSKFSFDILPTLKADFEFLSLLSETLPERELPYVKMAVREASKIYQMCSGSTVSRNINPLTNGQTKLEEFESPGPHFVFTLLFALDPSITAANVRTYIRSLRPHITV